MNIFYLDTDVKKAAQYHCDKHVVKMILETAQLLSTAHRLSGSDDDRLYKLTHKNHPSAVWVRSNKNQYLWTYQLFTELSDEYTRRYGKIHLSYTKLKDVLREVPELDDAAFTQPPQCMPDEYKVDGDSVLAYRNYYMGGKSEFAQWNHSPTPEWYSND